MEQYIIEICDAILAAMKTGIMPPGFTVAQEALDDLWNHFVMIIGVFLDYAHKNPSVTQPPYGADLNRYISELSDAYLQAVIDTQYTEDDPPTDLERLNTKEYYTFLVSAFLNYANTNNSEGIMNPPYTYARPYPQNSINRLEEFIVGLSVAFANALIGASYPPAMPASAEDVSKIRSYYEIPVRVFLSYAHDHPGVMNPPYS
jgi:hypothetical protein